MYGTMRKVSIRSLIDFTHILAEKNNKIVEKLARNFENTFKNFTNVDGVKIVQEIKALKDTEKRLLKVQEYFAQVIQSYPNYTKNTIVDVEMDDETFLLYMNYKLEGLI